MALPPPLQRLLKLPAFLLAVFLMYWSLPLSNLFLCIKAWKLLGDRDDVFQWCNFLVGIFRLRVRKVGDGELARDAGDGGADDGGDGKQQQQQQQQQGQQQQQQQGSQQQQRRQQQGVMYLSNHRSWTDFFVDAYLTEGRGQLMSRMAVLYAFPAFMVPVTLVRGCICFKRGSIADKDGFNAWVDGCVARSPIPGICLFPEGHRSRLPTSLPLKRGMLHYAYGRGMPVQVVMSANKELALDEKRLHVRFGSTLVTGYGRLLRTADYATFEAFFAALQAEWDRMWLLVFSADAAELPPLEIGHRPGGFPYPWQLKLSQLFFTLLELWLMVTLVGWCWRAWLSAAAALAGAVGLAGPAVAALQAAPLAWLLVSVVSCYDTRLPRPLLAPDGSVLPHAAEAAAAAAAAAAGKKGKGASAEVAANGRSKAE